MYPKIYFTQWEYNLKVVKVYITNYQDNPGVIKVVPTNNEYNADIIGYLVDNEYNAQKKIYISRYVIWALP
jgi:hypothetical protein